MIALLSRNVISVSRGVAIGDECDWMNQANKVRNRVRVRTKACKILCVFSTSQLECHRRDVSEKMSYTNRHAVHRTWNLDTWIHCGFKSIKPDPPSVSTPHVGTRGIVGC